MRVTATIVDGTLAPRTFPGGHEFVRDVVEAFGDEIESVSFGKPTLEDVFVHLTGHRFDVSGRRTDDGGDVASGDGIDSPKSPRFHRPAQPCHRIFSTAAGVLILLGAGLKASFRPAGMPSDVNISSTFSAGFIVLVLLFTAIFATISTVEDRREGFLRACWSLGISPPHDRLRPGARRYDARMDSQLHFSRAGPACRKSASASMRSW